jgi:hypothetical protein
MSDETTPVEVPEAPTLPETPATVAELMPFLPLPYDYAKQWGLVFAEDLAQRLAAVQQENPSQHVAQPMLLTDGRYFLNGDLLTEVPNGLYGPGFQKLDIERFNEISVVPLADALALIPPPEEPENV